MVLGVPPTEVVPEPEPVAVVPPAPAVTEVDPVPVAPDPVVPDVVPVVGVVAGSVAGTVPVGCVSGFPGVEEFVPVLGVP